MNRHHRLHLAIIFAAAVLALNALAVAQGWSPFPLPESRSLPARQASPLSDPVTPVATTLDRKSLLQSLRRASRIS